MKIFISIGLFILLSVSAMSQSLNTYILQTSHLMPVSKMKRTLKLRQSDKIRIIFPELNLYSLELMNAEKYLPSLKRNKLVEFIEKDEELELRKIPNDTSFTKQYALQRIKADEVWEFSTGGLTFAGDTIVIAILDDGMDVFHSDLIDNIWTNNMEIEDDGVDNDGNGYIDDFYGVNILNKNGYHRKTNHGTSVAGIIGAVGNNITDIAGINWNVKLLPVTDILSKERLIEGYNFIYTLRKKYNETSGKEGAFIVCANFSGGTSTPQFPEDSKINTMWCEIYDLLGEVGIISVASSDNFPRDVEIKGDMPTLCTSDFLLTVTSTDKNDKFYSGSSYGKTSVDIAAPGRQIYTLAKNNGINTSFDGNSATAPMVSGAIGLLYTIPCDNFIKEMKDNPAEFSLQIKDFIMEYSDKHSDLKDKTVSGGRLNILESYVNFMEQMCTALNYRELKIIKIYPNPTSKEVKIGFETPNFHKHRIEIFNSLGQIVYKEIFRPAPYDIAEKTIDVSGFSAGIYYFSLTSNKKRVTKQIVVY